MSFIAAYDGDAAASWNKGSFPSGLASRDPVRSVYPSNLPPLVSSDSGASGYETNSGSHYSHSSEAYASSIPSSHSFHQHNPSSNSLTMSTYPQHGAYDLHQKTAVRAATGVSSDIPQRAFLLCCDSPSVRAYDYPPRCLLSSLHARRRSCCLFCTQHISAQRSSSHWLRSVALPSRCFVQHWDINITLGRRIHNGALG